MLTVYDSHHIPTNRDRKGHIACHTNTGFFMGRGEKRRVYHAHLDLANRRLRFYWLVQKWAEHQARCRFADKEKYI